MQSFIEELVHERVAAWKEEVERLSAFARTEPHAAYSAFPHGLALPARHGGLKVINPTAKSNEQTYQRD